MSKPPRLGRGLSALLGEAATAPASAETRTLPVTALEPGPFQARGPMDQASLEELAASIREHGILQPILVRPKPHAQGSYQIIGGERRWRAAQLAQRHDVPVVVREFTDAEAMAAGLVENLQREDLNAVEEAEGYDRLTTQFGLTQQQLADSLGKSRSHIANTLRLLALPERVRDLVREGALSAGHARALLGAPDPVSAALQVVDRGLNVRQAESLAKPAAAPARERAPKPPQPNAYAAADVVALERDLERKLGLKVSIAASDKGGRITLNYSSLDQFEHILGLLTQARW